MKDATVKLESSRWNIMQILGKAGHLGTNDRVMLYTLRAIWADMTEEYIRNQLDYLEKRELICLTRYPDPSKPWWASLSRTGTDIVNYTIECEDGIARPSKYW